MQQLLSVTVNRNYVLMHCEAGECSVITERAELRHVKSCKEEGGTRAGDNLEDNMTQG